MSYDEYHAVLFYSIIGVLLLILVAIAHG